MTTDGIYFANDAERDFVIRYLWRIPKAPEPVVVWGGVEVRTHPFLPRGTVAVISGANVQLFTIDQGYDANGSPA